MAIFYNYKFVERMGKLKVIVLSGFLGSGKTTFIKNVLEFSDDLRIAIILNDVSQFDMDMDLVKAKSIKFKKTNDMIQIGGGCVCCTLKDEMIKQVKKIYKSKKYDYLFIQATGISTPLPVAQAFHATQGILKMVEVYSMITVIDAQNFLINLTSDQIIKEEQKISKKSRRSARIRSIQEKHHHAHHHEMEEQEQKPTLSELMISQLQIANIIVVNKKDLVTESELERVMCYLKSINPNSQIVATSYSKVDLKSLFSVKRFDLETAEKDQKWILEKSKIEDIPETIKYNISSFVYQARRPFQPYKFFALINSEKNYPFWNKITRAKGFFWLANYPRFAFTIQKAGARIYYQLDQPWWCQISKQHWGQTKEQIQQSKKFIDRFWDKNVGDKRNQIVFISQDLDRKQIEHKLNSCLIKEDEMDKYQEIYEKIEDPFKGRWKDGENMFYQQGILLQNEGDWEEVEDEQSQSEEQLSPRKNNEKRISHKMPNKRIKVSD